MKTISQMTQKEKAQAILEYTPCKRERKTVLNYLLQYAVMIQNR